MQRIGIEPKQGKRKAMNESKVSIIIPAYNEEDIIEEIVTHPLDFPNLGQIAEDKHHLVDIIALMSYTGSANDHRNVRARSLFNITDKLLKLFNIDQY